VYPLKILKINNILASARQVHLLGLFAYGGKTHTALKSSDELYISYSSVDYLSLIFFLFHSLFTSL